MIPPETNIREAYKGGRDAEQRFIANLALFLSTFMKEHGNLVEVSSKTELTLAHENAIDIAHSTVS